MSGLTFIDNEFKMHGYGENNANFQPARQDTTSVVNKHFYAWLAADGAHVIMERNLADTANVTTKYFFAKTGFVANWAGHAALTFQEYNELFD